MHAKKLAISVVSLLACFAGVGVFASMQNDESTFGDGNAANIEDSPTSAYTMSENSADYAHSPRFQEFKLQPNLNLWGYTGNNTLGEGQFLLPIYGDPSKVLYGLAEGNMVVNNDNWLIGGGLGYRQVVNNQLIFGGYALLDYNNTNNDNGFVMFNPGAEVLGEVWDVNINGYFPLGANKRMSDEMWADSLLNVSDLNARNYIRFTGHNEYAHKFQLSEEAGHGFGFAVGHVIPYFPKAKFSLGGYYFDTDDLGSTNGIETKFTYGLNKYTALELKNTYDKVRHNKTLLGVKLTFGGYSEEQKQNFGISSRLMDPLDHDFARLNGGTGVFTQKGYVDKGEFHEHDNLWFFEPAGSVAVKNAKSSGAAVGSGTYEDPFVDFTPTNEGMVKNIGVIDPYPLLYFAPGNYSFQAFTSKVGQGRFDLPNGWGMYGRSTDYKASALGNDRPQFSGGLDLNYANGAGRASNNIISIRITNNQRVTGSGAAASVLYANNASNVVLQDVDVANSAAVNNTIYGIYANNSSINFNAGTNNISAMNSGGVVATDAAVGIVASNGSILSFNDGTNNVSSKSTGVGDTKAIATYQASSLNFNGGKNNVSADANAGSGGAIGISGNDANSKVTFNGGDNNVSGTSASNGGYGMNISNSKATFNGGKNNVSGYSNAIGGLLAIGVDGGNADIVFNGGENNISASGMAKSFGIYLYGYHTLGISSVTFNGGINNISASSSGNDAYGIGAYAITGDNVFVTFNGGQNNVSSNSVAAGKNSYGVYVNEGVLTFHGGQNSISSTSAKGIAYGIGAAGSLTGADIVFSNPTGADKLNITVNGATAQFGIDAEQLSTIYEVIGGATQFMSSSDIANYVEFSNTSAIVSGLKVKWAHPQGSGTWPINW